MCNGCVFLRGKGQTEQGNTVLTSLTWSFRKLNKTDPSPPRASYKAVGGQGVICSPQCGAGLHSHLLQQFCPIPPVCQLPPALHRLRQASELCPELPGHRDLQERLLYLPVPCPRSLCSSTRVSAPPGTLHPPSCFPVVAFDPRPKAPSPHPYSAGCPSSSSYSRRLHGQLCLFIYRFMLKQSI